MKKPTYKRITDSFRDKFLDAVKQNPSILTVNDVVLSRTDGIFLKVIIDY